MTESTAWPFVEDWRFTADRLTRALQDMGYPILVDHMERAVHHVFIKNPSNLADLASNQARLEWQDIATAPKDGTAVLVMRNIWPGTQSGHAEECNGHNTYVAEWWAGENRGAGAWICYMDATCDPQCPVDPTHWMPLPTAPTTKD